MNTHAIIQTDNQYLLQVYKRPPFVIERGEGSTVYDANGKAYLDLVGGIAVNSLGYGDPEVLQAIHNQAANLIHVSNLYYTAPQARLGQLLVEHSFADRVFLCNSGAESIEGAFKFARAWGKRHPGGGDDQVEIVAFTNGFHGRTFGSLSATDREKYQAPFRPLVPGIRFAHFNDLNSAAEAITDKTCAVVVEPIQGEGGIHPATPAFLQGLRDLCDERGTLLIFDEIQCGLGRTGTLWAYEEAGVVPDIMTLAKPLGGGLPIGAVLMTQEVADTIHPGEHGSTFAGNPVACAVGEVVVQRVSQPAFLASVREKGDYVIGRLQRMESPHIKAVRGRGLILGVELDIPATELIARGYEAGLLMVNAGDMVLRLEPPLIITLAELDSALDRIEQMLTTL